MSTSWGLRARPSRLPASRDGSSGGATAKPGSRFSFLSGDSLRELIRRQHLRPADLQPVLASRSMYPLVSCCGHAGVVCRCDTRGPATRASCSNVLDEAFVSLGTLPPHPRRGSGTRGAAPGLWLGRRSLHRTETPPPRILPAAAPEPPAKRCCGPGSRGAWWQGQTPAPQAPQDQVQVWTLRVPSGIGWPCLGQEPQNGQPPSRGPPGFQNFLQATKAFRSRHRPGH